MKGIKGISFPFRFDGRGGVAVSSTSRHDFSHIRESISQILHTSTTERINEPHVGSGALSSLFGTPDSTDIATLKLLIKKALKSQESRVDVKDVRIDYQETNDLEGVYKIEIDVTVIKYMADHTITVTL